MLPPLPQRLAALPLALLPLSPLAAAQDSAPFRVLDNDEGAWIDLVTPAIRPVALEPGTGRVWAVNAQDSTVVEVAPDGAVLREVRVPWGPVAVAWWSDAEGGGRSVLVVCRNSTALVRVDVGSGEIVSLVPLGSEPSDVLVHPGTGHAFVTLAGVDAVVEVDVESGELVRRFEVPSRRPTFLALHGDDVLVAPMLSGNNSAIDDAGLILAPGEGRVLDLEDPAVALRGLADHDLFRLGDDGVVPVARDMGAVLFAVGVHPDTGEVWQLGTEAVNKDAAQVGEPAIRGHFIENRIARTKLVPDQVVEPLEVRNLDDHDPFTDGVQYDPPRSVGQPYALAFGPDGAAYVTGLLTHNVTQYTAAGEFVREWDVAAAPRGIVVTPDGTAAWVCGWIDGVLERYDLTQDPPAKTSSVSLGFDPTPAARQAGRALFFDGERSMFANASCASCHVEGDSDLLPWDLSDLPYDDKGPLVTQLMRGIADSVPLHWRGERGDLLAFNGAFEGLLGGAALDPAPGGEFEVFQDYVMSLLQPANPLEDERRVVVDRGSFRRASGELVNADAVSGQDQYFDFEIIPGVGSCNTCHALPTGTNNDIVFDEPDLDFARRTHFVVASFNGMWRKRQRTLERIQLADGTFESRPTLGVGVSATGLKDDLLDFVEIPLFFAGPKKKRDIAAFVEQVDNGLAPAVHKAYLLNGDEPYRTAKQLLGYLVRQGLQRNCDLVAFGTVRIGGIDRELRWAWDRGLERFVCEDSSVPSADVYFFLQQALAGTGNNVFLGLPVGMGRRFGIDFDADGLANLDELALGTDPENADSDGDGDPDGHEQANGGDPTDPAIVSNDLTPATVSNLRVVYVTSTLAKVLFETDEPATFDAQWTGGGESGGVASDLPQTVHTVLLRDLSPGNVAHDAWIDVVDLGGNTTHVALPPLVTLPFVNVPSVVLADASVTELQDSNGVLSVRLAGTALRKIGGLKTSGRALRVNVFKNGALTQESLQGAVSGSDGLMTLDVTESGLVPGDRIRIVVMSLYRPVANFGGDWSMPDTEVPDRSFDIEYTGTGQ